MKWTRSVSSEPWRHIHLHTSDDPGSRCRCRKNRCDHHFYQGRRGSVALPIQNCTQLMGWCHIVYAGMHSTDRSSLSSQMNVAWQSGPLFSNQTTIHTMSASGIASEIWLKSLILAVPHRNRILCCYNVKMAHTRPFWGLILTITSVSPELMPSRCVVQASTDQTGSYLHTFGVIIIVIKLS